MSSTALLYKEDLTTISNHKKDHDWNKEQPHHVDTGEITKRDYADKHPDKVEWVQVKK